MTKSFLPPTRCLTHNFFISLEKKWGKIQLFIILSNKTLVKNVLYRAMYTQRDNVNILTVRRMGSFCRYFAFVIQHNAAATLRKKDYKIKSEALNQCWALLRKFNRRINIDLELHNFYSLELTVRKGLMECSLHRRMSEKKPSSII